MNDYDILVQLKSLLTNLNSLHEENMKKHEKFKIALSNTLSLLIREQDIIANLQGSPQDLAAYLIREQIQLQEYVRESFVQLQVMLTDIIENAKK